MLPLLPDCSDFSDRKGYTAQNPPVAAMPEVPRRGQDPSFQLGPGSKEESKDGPPVVSELHVTIKHMQTKNHERQCHALQCSRSKKKNKRG
jgi:hypothetical protein